MMAIPSGLNPILATNLPLSLSAPRGENAAVDALRMSLLGVGAIHQAFLFAKKGQSESSQTASMLYRARTLREAAKDMLTSASHDPRFANHDAAIAAGATNALIDVSRLAVGLQDECHTHVVCRSSLAVSGGRTTLSWSRV